MFGRKQRRIRYLESLCEKFLDQKTEIVLEKIGLESQVRELQEVVDMMDPIIHEVALAMPKMKRLRPTTEERRRAQAKREQTAEVVGGLADESIRRQESEGTISTVAR